MEFLTYISAMLVLIGVLVTIHELGHYWAAVLCDVKVEAFSLGFGPRLFGFKRGETDFKICAIPLGGYVKMAGEMYGDGTTAAPEEPNDPRSFLAKPRYQRLFIAFAGPAMNMILAVVVLTGLYMVKFPKILMLDGKPTISAVQPGSAAAKAGLQDGDQILQINGKVDPRWDDILAELQLSVNKPLLLVYDRNGKQQSVTLTPEEDPTTGMGEVGIEGANEVEVAEVTKNMPAEAAGVKPGDLLVSANGHPIRALSSLVRRVREAKGQPIALVINRDGKEIDLTLTPKLDKQPTDKEPQYRVGILPRPRMTFAQLSFPQALSESISTNIKSSGAIYRLLQGMLVRRISAKSVEGPVRLAVVAGEKARDGFLPFMELMAAVSLNLAIINLLPIPILDGGMIVMLLVEMVARRDLSMKIKESVLKVGLAFLLMMVVLVLYNDITKLVN